MRTAPYIRLLLTIAILVAVAPLCATAAAECPSCIELSCFADEHEVPAQVAKRPVLSGSPTVASTVLHPLSSLRVTTVVRDIRREAPPAPAARLRV